METCNSLSGGKTSSYIAVHYPADIEIFALCCIDCHNAGAKIPKDMKQKVNDRLQKYCSHWPEFVATSEDPKILKVMFDLEQILGREIIWVRGMGWEQMIKYKKAIPNQAKRFCTTMLKMQPIFEYLFKYHELPVKMRIGYRYDEMERADNFDQLFKYAYKCEYYPKSNKWNHRWTDIQWRVGEFPLIDNKVFHHQIIEYWEDKNIDFPEDSNCLNCFWKQPAQLRKNFDTDNAIMQWSSIMEDLQGNTFKEKLNFHQISKLPIQLDFIYGTGSGCQAGFCTS
jgi:mRNA-degrading endonuclease HigB of HigAB toxin-antitoxin module